MHTAQVSSLQSADSPALRARLVNNAEPAVEVERRLICRGVIRVSLHGVHTRTALISPVAIRLPTVATHVAARS